MGSPTGAPNDRGTGDVLSGEGREVRALWSSLAASLGVVQSGPACCACGEQIEMSRAVHALPGRGEDVSGPEVSARDEAKNLGAAGGVSSARVQRAGLAGGAGYGFAGPGGPQAQADRLQHRSVVGVEPPQPGGVNLRGAEFDKPRVSSPGALALSCIWNNPF